MLFTFNIIKAPPSANAMALGYFYINQLKYILGYCKFMNLKS